MFLAKNLEMSVLLDYYAPVLTENQREVLRLYYNEDLSLAEIADGNGISRQGVRDSIKRGEAVMTELEEKLHFAEWYGSTLRVSAELKRVAQDIITEASATPRGGLVAKKAETIISLLDGLEHE